MGAIIRAERVAHHPAYMSCHDTICILPPPHLCALLPSQHARCCMTHGCTKSSNDRFPREPKIHSLFPREPKYILCFQGSQKSFPLQVACGLHCRLWTFYCPSLVTAVQYVLLLGGCHLAVSQVNRRPRAIIALVVTPMWANATAQHCLGQHRLGQHYSGQL